MHLEARDAMLALQVHDEALLLSRSYLQYNWLSGAWFTHVYSSLSAGFGLCSRA